MIYRSGLIAKRGVEIPLDSVNAIHFDQKIWERLLGLGDLKVDSASVADSASARAETYSAVRRCAAWAGFAQTRASAASDAPKERAR